MQPTKGVCKLIPLFVSSSVKALFKAEDEQDACAATKAKAEQAAELAEFDEGIPFSEEAGSKVNVDIFLLAIKSHVINVLILVLI